MIGMSKFTIFWKFILLLLLFHSQIFDATTNTWKIVNERSHTDFVEKIVETPRERIIIDDITDITKIKSINDHTERTTDITDITDINTVKNTYNIHETEETILREVTKEVRKYNPFLRDSN